MIRTRLQPIGLCIIVLGAMAMFASSAQAGFSWLVLNLAGTINTEVKEEGGAVNLLAKVDGEKDSAHLTLLTKLAGMMLSVTCTNLSFSNISLEKEGKLSLGKAIFTGCGVYNGAPPLGTGQFTCVVKTPGSAAGTIETETFTSKLVLHEVSKTEKVVLLEVVPDNAEEKFAEIEFTGPECSLPNPNPVKGLVFLKDCEAKATVHQIKHLVEQGPLTVLFVGKDTTEHLETSLIGSAWAKLGNTGGGVDHTGLKWAAMDV